MNRQYITTEPKIVSMDTKPIKSNSSFGNWRVDYFIKWHLIDKNPIGTMIFFWSKQEALEWINNHKI